ncbi:spinster family MFS transporter [Hoeflea poritis]|uniref:MFS transporter n=1 Tax=Hoeflea poritis TaxID=2993659 RepID=A0ABT4VR53_9HYPH|nr:MFS transporter [Hoeflea poritis]MDA4847186.1 MFS transporter [Hoeflea poritis]
MPDNRAGSKAGQNLLVVVVLLGIINLVNQMDRVLFALMVEPVKADLGLSDSQMGLLGGLAFAVCYAGLGLVAGRIADRWNRVHLIAIALTVWSAATAACGMSYSFLQMFVSRMMVGTGEAGCVPSAQSLISDVTPARNRAFMISLFTGIGTIGTLIGLIVGGIVLEMVGWRMTFIVFGAFGLLPLVLLLVMLRDPREVRSATAAASNVVWSQDVVSMLKRREIQLLLVAIPLLFTLAGLATWIPAFFQRSYGVTIEEFSRSGGAFLGFGLIIGTFAGGFIVNKLVARDARWEFWWSALSCSLAVVPFMAVLIGHNVQVAYYGLFGAFFLAGTGFGPAMACMHTVSKQSVRATAVALMMFASSLIAYGAVPAIIGVLSDLFASFGAGIDDGTSLKYALLCSMTLPPVASILFLVAAHRVVPAASMSLAKHST